MIICCPNFLTSPLVPFDAARLPALMSTWLAVTTMCAIWASVGAWADAPVAETTSKPAMVMADTFMVTSLTVSTTASGRRFHEVPVASVGLPD